jgi:hypothetical protein
MEGIERVKVRVLPSGLVCRRDAARYLGRTPKTLAMWALAKKGPTPVHVEGRVFYRYEELRQRAEAGQAGEAA